MFALLRNHIRKAVLALAFFLIVRASAEDWPTYQHDVARSGVTGEKLALPLSEAWNLVPTHPPAPAWGDPQRKPVEGYLELPRVKFDDAFHVVAADGSVFFGSSADNTVYCYDVATGEARWTRITGAPIRLSPTVADGKVFVGSDDGHVYCLDGEDGRLLWDFRAAPTEEKVLGHGKMVSIWPIRTGVLVDNGVAYFGAGIFPHEGLYFYAVRAADGERIWVNDSFGWVHTRGVSPQGYLLASATKLFMPSGRAAPAAYDRATGGFLFQSRGSKQTDGLFGGTYALLTEDQLYSGAEQVIAYDQESGRTGFAWFHGRHLIVTPEVSYMLSDTELSALDRTTFPEASRERQKLLWQRSKLIRTEKTLQRSLKAARLKPETDRDAAKLIASLEKEMAEVLTPMKEALSEEEEKVAKLVENTKNWRMDCDCPDSMILAGGMLFVGGPDKVMAVDAATGRKFWTGKVNGTAKGLAAANGRLFVSTDKGNIHCFVQDKVSVPKQISPSREAAPYPNDSLTVFYKTVAESIVQDTGIKKGYCLIIGAETGRLARELAGRTDLMIYGIEEDLKKVEEARRALSAAGLYGARVCIGRESYETPSYPDYFANLIVYEDAFLTGSLRTPPEEILRMLKPLGGVAWVGQPAGVKDRGAPLDAEGLKKWTAALSRSNVRISMKESAWAKITRGRLDGAGSWTHQYAEPGNTACGDDQAVKCPLGLLWFGEPGPGQMPSRHLSAAAPLSTNGRMFVQGENVVMAYDPYNGVKLWEREIPGAMRTGTKQECGNLAASEDSLFVAVEDKCLRLDAATGETKMTYHLPPSRDGEPRRWGYVALVGNTLYGSATPSRLNSDAFFALDVKTGRPRWVHYGESMMHISMGIGDGKVFLIESSVTEEQRKAVKAEKGAIVRLVMALDARNGKALWQKPVDLTNCIKIGAGGGEVSVIYKDKVLLLCMVPMNGHFWKEFLAGDFTRRSIIALSSDTGEMLWSDKIGYRSRPLVIGDTIYAEPWAHDLRTGEPRMRIDPVTGQQAKWQISRSGHHCGCMAAAPNCLMFRSDSIAYYDLIQDYGTSNFGGQRPGCWINFIAANGLVMVPEASSGCICPFPIQCTVVLHPRKEDRVWGIYSCPGPVTPVKHIAVNLGAPGERKDGKGTLWLAYPRPYIGRLVFEFNLGATMLDSGRYFTHNPDILPIEGTDDPWIFTSGCSGLTRCVLPLVGNGEPPGEYTVRLYFSELVHEKAGERVFDIKLQDRVVCRDFDIFKEAGARNKAVVKEFKGVEVPDDLKIDLAPRAENPTEDQAPVLCGIEAVRSHTVPLSLAAPSFLLSDYQREQTGEVRIVNLEDKEFVGKLQARAPVGFRVSPTETSVRVPANGEKTIVLKAALTKKIKAGEYEIGLKLIRSGGGVGTEKSALVNYTGASGEVVLAAIEDASVRKQAPDGNYGTAGALSVDGGSSEMEDGGHAITFLKFRLDVPGKPISASLRMQVNTTTQAQSRDAGRIYLVKGAWDEKTITYANKPALGEEVGVVGKIENGEKIERDLNINLEGMKELSLAIVPTSLDGASFLSREGGAPPELVVKIGGR